MNQMTIISILMSLCLLSCKEGSKPSLEKNQAVLELVKPTDSIDISEKTLDENPKEEIEATPEEPVIKKAEHKAATLNNKTSKGQEKSSIPSPVEKEKNTSTAEKIEFKNEEPEIIPELDRLVKEETTHNSNPVFSEIEETNVEDNSEIEEIKENKPEAILKFSHAALDRLLKKYVSEKGNVNYKGMKAEEGVLDAYLLTLKNNPVQAHWSREEKLAYWINAYNAFTLKLILKNYPLKQITDLHNGKPWDLKWIELGSKTYSLNDIENGIIRPEFNEPRIHFAVNCAAKSCPPLLNMAWTAENLESNLEKQTIAFINNSDFNTINDNQLVLSKIFEWYADDFGDVKTYIMRFSKTSINSSTKITYNEYNWALNN